MKKLLSALVILFLATGVHAQTLMAETDPAGATSTVNTNGDTSYHTITLSGNINNYAILNFSIYGTKLTGTISGGAVTLWGSNDNSHWKAVYGASTAAMADTVTSQSLANSDTNFEFLVTNTWYKYYRVRVITTGTQTSSYDCYLTARKNPN